MITQDKILIILLAITCSIILSEIKYDKTRWKAGKSDKPISTILRSGLIALVVIVNWIATGDFMSALKVLGVMFGTYLLVFDFDLNVSRWKDLPLPYHWKVAHKKHLNIWDKILMWISEFTTRFFWHGDVETKSIYDKIFQRIPPLAELLFKGCVFGTLIYFYYS